MLCQHAKMCFLNVHNSLTGARAGGGREQWHSSCGTSRDVSWIMDGMFSWLNELSTLLWANQNLRRCVFPTECPGDLSAWGEDEMLKINTLLIFSCLSCRCQITSGRSVRATSPCAAGAATAARAIRAVVRAASSEDSRNVHCTLIYYTFCLMPRNDLLFICFSKAFPVL